MFSSRDLISGLPIHPLWDTSCGVQDGYSGVFQLGVIDPTKLEDTRSMAAKFRSHDGGIPLYNENFTDLFER